MPIEVLSNKIGRFIAGHVSAGFLFLMLMMFSSACAPMADGQLPASLTPFEPQISTPVIKLTPPPPDTTISLEPPTLTSIPTKSLQTSQLSEDSAGLALPSPSLVRPVQTVPPLSTPVPVPIVTSAATLSVPTISTTPETAYDTYVIGESVRGLPIIAHRFGDGVQHIVIVGGIHGGYEWNTILLAYRAIDYFKTYFAALPETVTLTIIPSANPDGQELVTGKVGSFSLADLAADTIPGRFNANNVDLNRNWDCQWAPSAIWRGNEVSGGPAPFSEPETVVLRDYLLQQHPEAVIFLHSAANGVFASGCPETHQPSMELAQIYGEAAGYPVYERFSAYDVTGDAGDWLTKQDITAISVELINHQDLDLEKNLAGMLAVLELYR